jgi:hypothetical protein
MSGVQRRIAFRDLKFSGASNAYTTQVRAPAMPHMIRSWFQFLENRPARLKVETGVRTDTKTQHGDFEIKEKVSLCLRESEKMRMATFDFTISVRKKNIGSH